MYELKELVAAVNAYTADTRKTLKLVGYPAEQLRFWEEHVHSKRPNRILILCTSFWAALIGAPMLRLALAVKEAWRKKGVRIGAAIVAVLATLVACVVFNTVLIVVASVIVATYTIAGLFVGFWIYGEKFWDKTYPGFGQVKRHTLLFLSVLILGVGGVATMIVTLWLFRLLGIAWKTEPVRRAWTWYAHRYLWGGITPNGIVTAVAFFTVQAYAVAVGWWYIPLLTVTSVMVIAASVFAGFFGDKLRTRRQEQARLKRDAEMEKEYRLVADRLEAIFLLVYADLALAGLAGHEGYAAWKAERVAVLTKEYGNDWPLRLLESDSLPWEPFRKYTTWKTDEATGTILQIERDLWKSADAEPQTTPRPPTRLTKFTAACGEFLILLWAYTKALKSKICPFVEYEK